MCVCGVNGAGVGVPSLELLIEVRFLGEVIELTCCSEAGERDICGKPPALGRGL